MKQELFFINLLSKIIKDNENALNYYLYSLKYVEKILIFIYADCAKIYEFEQFDFSIKMKSYYTKDFNKDELNRQIYEYENQKEGYPQNKINFQQFIIDNPIDNINGKYFEKEYPIE